MKGYYNRDSVLRWLHKVIIYGVARESVMLECCFWIRVFTQSSQTCQM